MQKPGFWPRLRKFCGNWFFTLVPQAIARKRHYPLPITDYPLPITDYRLPITNYQIPKTEFVRA